MTAERKAQLDQAATIFVETRRSGNQIADLPAELKPQSFEEAYYVQDTMALTFGGRGGWKIGGPPTAEPFYGPMPKAWFVPSGSTVTGSIFRGVEPEIAYKMGKDLPPRSTPYTREEVVAAIESAHPVIELLEVAFKDVSGIEKFTMFGDLQMNGGFVYGPAFDNWQTIDFAKESVKLVINGELKAEKTASNPAGTDLLRLMVYLANDAAPRTGGLKKGEWITTGSWNGNTPAPAGAHCEVHFSTAGNVDMRFA